MVEQESLCFGNTKICLSLSQKHEWNHLCDALPYITKSFSVNTPLTLA